MKTKHLLFCFPRIGSTTENSGFFNVSFSVCGINKVLVLSCLALVILQHVYLPKEYLPPQSVRYSSVFHLLFLHRD